eukprot:3886109-Alexandrium_andersonii.AAC.1
MCAEGVKTDGAGQSGTAEAKNKPSRVVEPISLEELSTEGMSELLRLIEAWPGTRQIRTIACEICSFASACVRCI